MTAIATSPVPTTTIPAAEDTSPAPRKRSGGPRTPEGKARSRQNALKHGMRAEVVVPAEMEPAIAARREVLADEIRPRTAQEAWLVGQIALAQVRLARLETLRHEDARRVLSAAQDTWQVDRRVAVEAIGARLDSDPARHLASLRHSRQGVEWMLERWYALDEALRRFGRWTEEQWQLAHNLLGVPIALRGCCPELPATPEETADDESLAELVAEYIEVYERDCETLLDQIDAQERQWTAMGLPIYEDAPSARLRRYEAAIRRDLR